ncbi:MAG: DUF885 domain-containing protein [Xanthomonadales bacterium]|nr:DUF885 domain-containing protein [Xanthomonadales bacterium]
MPLRSLLPLACLVLAIATGCARPAGDAASPGATTGANGTTTAASATSPAELGALFEQYFEESLELNPLMATQLGDRRYNDRLPNVLGAEHRQAQKAFAERWLERMRAIDADALASQDRLSLDMFVRARERDIESHRFPSHLQPVNQFYNLASMFAMLGSGTNAQPFQSVEDYDNWLARLQRFPVLIDQAIANMREGMASGVVQPRVLMEKAVPQIRAHVVDAVEDSVFWRPVANMPATIEGAERERLTAAMRETLAGAVIPTYARLAAFIEDEYMPAARDTVGMWDLPDGRAWYAFQVRNITTTDLSPEQIHQIGLDEVARILERMDEVRERVGFTGSREEFFAFTGSDARFFFDTEAELLAGYEAMREVIGPRLDRLFDTKPKADFEIRAVEPFRAASASAASYQRPSEDGTRPGVFYVNTANLHARPSWAMMALYLHEAEPGHHYQLALQQELPELPRFRRFGGYTAYSEGWGLYAESLGEELDAYEDPYAWYGRLAAELWRSIRLVADTGLHHLGWTREQTLAYMRAHSPEPEERMVAEAERFMAIPGQALAYKIGELKIRELRTRAEQALGERFDVRAFHTQVLEDGALPLDTLEAKIDRWIAAQGG